MEEIIIENENLLNLLNKAREITGTTYKNNLEEEMHDNCAYYSKAEEIDFHERDLF